LLKLENSPQQRENLMLNIGFNNLRLGLTDDAKDIFKRFQKEFPRSPQIDMALYGEMFAHTQKNNFTDAEKVYAELKIKYPQSILIPQAGQHLQQAKSERK